MSSNCTCHTEEGCRACKLDAFMADLKRISEQHGVFLRDYGDVYEYSVDLRDENNEILSDEGDINFREFTAKLYVPYVPPAPPEPEYGPQLPLTGMAQMSKILQEQYLPKMREFLEGPSALEHLFYSADHGATDGAIIGIAHADWYTRTESHPDGKSGYCGPVPFNVTSDDGPILRPSPNWDVITPGRTSYYKGPTDGFIQWDSKIPKMIETESGQMYQIIASVPCKEDEEVSIEHRYNEETDAIDIIYHTKKKGD